MRSGKSFRYLDANGRAIKDKTALSRIRSLAIPPAWKDVWICPNPNGHIQATGRDDRGRKQYRYHARWRAVRDETKYNRMIAFGRALPKLRQRINRDIRSRGLGREKVLAALVHLMDLSAIRVGNDEYANQNKSYGLTTLRDRHAEVNGSKIHLRFRGKSGKDHAITVDHPTLSRIVKKCQDLPGQELFQYLDEQGQVHDVTSGDVNQYLLETCGQDFTSKDFRTWTGTVLAALALRELEEIDPRGRTRKKMIRAVERVAQRLGNTPAVCKKCYVHPVIFDSYLDGSLVEALGRRAEKVMSQSLSHLRPEEAAIVTLLRQRLRENAVPLTTRLGRSLRMVRSGKKISGRIRNLKSTKPRKGNRHASHT